MQQLKNKLFNPPCYSRTLDNPGQPWNTGTLLEPWTTLDNPGTLEPWSPGTLDPLKLVTLEHPGTLEPWNPTTPWIKKKHIFCVAAPPIL